MFWTGMYWQTKKHPVPKKNKLQRKKYNSNTPPGESKQTATIATAKSRIADGYLGETVSPSLLDAFLGPDVVCILGE